MTDKDRVIGRELRRRGFDQSRFSRRLGHWRVRCSQCQALVINGMACHETGCHNARKARSR
jgi:hypothetical protein